MNNFQHIIQRAEANLVLANDNHDEHGRFASGGGSAKSKAASIDPAHKVLFDSAIAGKVPKDHAEIVRAIQMNPHSAANYLISKAAGEKEHEDKIKKARKIFFEMVTAPVIGALIWEKLVRPNVEKILDKNEPVQNASSSKVPKGTIAKQ